MTSARAPEPNMIVEPAFLSVPEAAKLLGVSRNSLYAAIERGKVPGVRRIGKLLRVRRAAILNDDAWPQSAAE